LRPAKYDDLITVKTFLKELPENHKVIFYSEIFNEQGELLTTGNVTLYFIESKTMKRCNMPVELKEKLSPYFA